ncbi:MAG: hypothetical protein GY751_23080 [Bacteroidetes bacterium]|nr:hypothetical protein [Bacteroidota bacterium]
MPIVIAADGLYPYDNVFKTCASNGWRFIITFKDGNLPSVWEEVDLLKKLQFHRTMFLYHLLAGYIRMCIALAVWD